MLLSDDDEDVVMEEAGEEEDDDVYDPTFVDPRPPPADTANTRSHIRRPAPVLFPARSSSPSTVRPSSCCVHAHPSRRSRQPSHASFAALCLLQPLTHYDSRTTQTRTTTRLGRRIGAGLVSAMARQGQRGKKGGSKERGGRETDATLYSPRAPRLRQLITCRAIITA